MYHIYISHLFHHTQKVIQLDRNAGKDLFLPLLDFMWLNVPVFIIPHDTAFSWCPWESLLFSDRNRLGWLWERGRSKGEGETWGMREMGNFSQEI